MVLTTNYLNFLNILEENFVFFGGNFQKRYTCTLYIVHILICTYFLGIFFFNTVSEHSIFKCNCSVV